MHLLAYTHAHRLRDPTGVGNHIANVLSHLGRRGDVDLTLLISHRDRESLATTQLAGARVKTFPLAVSPMQYLWWATDRPKGETWDARTDWVYCPAESYVPTRRRLAVTVHDVYPFERHLPWAETSAKRQLRWRWRLLFSKILRKADLLLTVSEFTKGRIVELLGFPESRIAVVGNGVDSTYFLAANDRDDRRAEEPYLLVIGGLSLKKGGDRVLDVAKLLERQRSPIRIVVAGKNDPSLSAAAGHLPNVTLLGYVQQPHLRKLLGNALALLFLSRYEGFGIPVLEAMALQTPVLISDQPALVDVAGGAAPVVNDPSEVLEICAILQGDSRFISELLVKGRARAEEFSWDSCAERVKKALERG